jgi:hypothetical protein
MAGRFVMRPRSAAAAGTKRDESFRPSARLHRGTCISVRPALRDNVHYLVLAQTNIAADQAVAQSLRVQLEHFPGLTCNAALHHYIQAVGKGRGISSCPH